MKTKSGLLALFMICVTPILFFSCDQEEITYSTDDLKGDWEGDLRFEIYEGGAPTIVLRTTQFSFGDNGEFESLGPDGPDYESITGNLIVAEDGKITGVITTIHTTHSGFNTETTSMNWEGSLFESETEINVAMDWPWQNIGPSSSAWGHVLITGSLTKQ